MIRRLYKIWETDFKRFISYNDVTQLYTLEQIITKNYNLKELNYELVECTNYKDGNGQLIFEGDIIEFNPEWYLRYKMNSNKNYPYEVVVINKAQTNFVLKNITNYKLDNLKDNDKLEFVTPLTIIDLQQSKIIGNVYNNKDTI
jgi:uncharacterized phage protein (TIGR01671 family)